MTPPWVPQRNPLNTVAPWPFPGSALATIPMDDIAKPAVVAATIVSSISVFILYINLLDNLVPKKSFEDNLVHCGTGVGK